MPPDVAPNKDLTLYWDTRSPSQNQVLSNLVAGQSDLSVSMSLTYLVGLCQLQIFVPLEEVLLHYQVTGSVSSASANLLDARNDGRVAPEREE